MDPAVIPNPFRVQSRAGVFRLTPETRMIVDPSRSGAGEFLAGQLRRATGFGINVEAGTAAEAANAIRFTTRDARAAFGSEGYELNVSSNEVVIRASEPAGLFYGAQTLLQLLPPEIFSSNVIRGAQWVIPCVEIEDRPRFQWRGLMLDVSRHFFSVSEVKHLLDLMALQKLNTFHWHLVDDQGWRIEIEKYPKLTEVGAWRTNASLIRADQSISPVNLHPAWTEPRSDRFRSDGRYGGFYTQDEIREVVAYAAARHITVVPEIELPGHSTAALAAYPELSCFGEPFDVDLGAGVHRGIYCAGNDAVFSFLEDVLKEVIPLFPEKYVHIGGDEVEKDTWKRCPKCQSRIQRESLKNEEELQSYFIRRVERMLTTHDRTLIGWSEIRQGGLAQNAVVMDWIGGGQEAALAGHNVVMSPTTHCYFDYYQSQDRSREPRAIGGFLPLSKVYAFEPVPAGLGADAERHILGAQANVWTEYIASREHLEYMVFPRLSALAEVVWSARDARDESDFMRRLLRQNARLEQLGVNYRRGLAEAKGGDR